MKFKKFYIVYIIISIIIFSTLSGCSFSSKDKSVSKSGFYFDTIINITIYGTDDEAYIDECFKLAEKYENLFSNTIKDSDISRINNAAGKEFVDVDSETIDILSTAIKYSRINDKFDITLGKLSDLWNISEIAENITDENNVVDASYLPDDNEISKLLPHIDYHKIIINGNKVKLDDSMSKIDVGAIAKGYIADKIKDHLISKKIISAIINLGGNIVTIGTKTDGSDFTIGIQKPFSQSGQAYISFKSHDKSVVTSGIYERYFKIDDNIYHHIFDISNGYPIKNNLYSVTIISDFSIDGDALSTLCFTMGLVEGLDYIESIDSVEAIFIDNQYNVYNTSGLDNQINYIK